MNIQNNILVNVRILLLNERKLPLADQIMPVNDVADFLKVKPVTIRRQTEKGILPGFKIGNIWRVRKSDIDRFINDQLAQQGFSKKVAELWEDIQVDVAQSGYTVKDVPDLIKQIRAESAESE